MSPGHNVTEQLFESVTKWMAKEYAYEVERISTSEEWGRYIVETNYGVVEFRTWEDVNLLEKANHCRETLVKGQFRQIDRFIPGCDGQSYYVEEVNGERIGYSISDHFSPFKQTKDMVAKGRSLAKMHIAMKRYPLSDEDISFPRWDKRFQSNIDHFIQARKSVERVYGKSKVDMMFLVNFYSIMQRVRKAFKMLGEANYESIVTVAEGNRHWCHGKIEYSSLGLSNEGYISGLLDGVYDIQHYDLATYWLSLSKQEEINPTDIFSFFEGYRELNPLSSDDLKIIYSYILFPHPIWRNVYSLYLGNSEAIHEIEQLELRYELLISALKEQQQVERSYPLMMLLIRQSVEQEEGRKLGD